jgi:hypothetical protein
MNTALKTLSARYLLQYSTAALWDLLVGTFNLKFDDGTVITTNYRATGYSSYFWRMHREYPQTPILPHHHLDVILKGQVISAKTHIRLVGSVFWDVVECYQLKTPLQRDPLVKMVYEIVNELYVDLSHRAEAFVVSVDILDCLQVIDYPDIAPALLELNNSQESIDRAYNALITSLNKADDLGDNALARATRSQMVNQNQVLQCVGPRGFPTEVDGHIFTYPVLRSYTQGMRSLYDFAAESRSAAKSHYFAESPLQVAEYFARRLQLLAMVVERIHYETVPVEDPETQQRQYFDNGDCRSTNYVRWIVKPPQKTGNDVYPGDLTFLEGKYYLTTDEKGQPDTNELKVLKVNDEQLVGKTILLRSVLTCRDADPHAVCQVCFGRMADNFNHETNVGHNCAASITRQTTQSVLSNKHLDASSKAEPLMLNEITSQFFVTKGKNNAYYLRKDIVQSKPRLLIAQADVSNLTDVYIAPRIEDLDLTRISAIDMIALELEKRVPPYRTQMQISQHGQMAILSHDFLHYCKQHKWVSDSKYNLVFDLSDWNPDLPLFVLPAMEYSYSQHSGQIANLIESRIKDLTDRNRPDSPIRTLIDLFNLVNTKLNVNIALLEVIIYASMITDGPNDLYGLARNSTTASLGIARATLRNRSLSTAYAYEEQMKLIMDPRSFYQLDRPDCILDAFILPEAVVKPSP